MWYPTWYLLYVFTCLSTSFHGAAIITNRNVKKKYMKKLVTISWRKINKITSSCKLSQLQSLAHTGVIVRFSKRCDIIWFVNVLIYHYSSVVSKDISGVLQRNFQPSLFFHFLFSNISLQFSPFNYISFLIWSIHLVLRLPLHFLCVAFS